MAGGGGGSPAVYNGHAAPLLSTVTTNTTSPSSRNRHRLSITVPSAQAVEHRPTLLSSGLSFRTAVSDLDGQEEEEEDFCQQGEESNILDTRLVPLSSDAVPGARMPAPTTPVTLRGLGLLHVSSSDRTETDTETETDPEDEAEQERNRVIAASHAVASAQTEVNARRTSANTASTRISTASSNLTRPESASTNRTSADISSPYAKIYPETATNAVRPMQSEPNWRSDSRASGTTSGSLRETEEESNEDGVSSALAEEEEAESIIDHEVAELGVGDITLTNVVEAAVASSASSHELASPMVRPLRHSPASPASSWQPPPSPIEGSGTYTTTATGLLGRYDATDRQSSVNSGATSHSPNPTTKRGFFSSLLSRSTSQNNGSSSRGFSQVTKRSSSHNPLLSPPSTSTSLPTPGGTRPSSQIFDGQSRPSTALGMTHASPSTSSLAHAARAQAQHARHSSNPPSPSIRQMSGRTPQRSFDASYRTLPAAPSSAAENTQTPSRSHRFSLTSSPVTGSAGRFSSTDDTARGSPSPSMERTRGRFEFPLRSAGRASLDGHNRSPAAAGKAAIDPDTPSSLSDLGLSLLAMTPSLALGRYGQPLCGAVLDQKYLLIGTTFGLDFLPLNREGNRSARSGIFERLGVSGHHLGSSSNGRDGDAGLGQQDVRTRKPINLIKKTRFKQLVVLAERSNVLLAVAGRNDHVRVYALDTLRAIIEKKMREIDDKEGLPKPLTFSPAPASPSQSSTSRFSQSHGNGSVPPLPAIPSPFKGKGKSRETDSPLPPAGSSIENGDEASTSASGPMPRSDSTSSASASSSMMCTASTSSASMTSSSQYSHGAHSPPPAYSFADTDSARNTPNGSTRTGSATPGRRDRSVSMPHQTSPTQSVGHPSPLPTPSPSRAHFATVARQHISPPSSTQSRTMKQHRSRETLRRPSVSSAGHYPPPGSVSASSRRGSAATTIAPLSGNTIVAGGFNGGQNSRRRGSSFHAFTPPLPESTAVTDEQDYEWAVADSAVNGTGSPDVQSSPTFTRNRTSSSGSANNNARMRSNAAGHTLQPRAAQVGLSIINGDDDTEEFDTRDGDATVDGRSRSTKENRRMSLAEMMLDSRSSQSSAYAPSPVARQGMLRSASAGVTSTLSSPTSTFSNGRPRPMPRSPTAASNSELAELAAFLRSEQPPTASPGGHNRQLLLSTATADSAASSSSDSGSPEIRPTANNGGSAVPGRRASSVASQNGSPVTGGARGKGKAKLIPRSPVVERKEEAGEGGQNGPSLIDIIRQGPPNGEGASQGQATAEPADVTTANGTGSKAKRPAKLRKASSNGTSITAMRVAHEERSAQEPAAVSSEPHSNNGGDDPRLALATSRPVQLQARSPVVQRSGSDTDRASADMPRSMSLSQMLAEEGPSPERASTSLRRSNTTRDDATSAAFAKARNRKRWSLLDGLRSPPTSSSSAMMHSESSTTIASQATASPLIDHAAQMGRQASGSNASVSARSASMNQTESTVPLPAERGVASDALPATVVGHAESIEPLKRRPRDPEDDDGSGAFGDLRPEVPNGATHPDGTSSITFTNARSDGVVDDGLAGNGVAGRGIAGQRQGEEGPGPHGSVPLGQLEYVKLARTKGSRFIRASETKRKTYLAVLCGESGERIELFTGSKNVSLSLNRTFVLPETPRTIEFQLQGEELLDLYLIYDSAIFALEPSTVRVREVAIQRNERRAARRERERIMREQATLEGRDIGQHEEESGSRREARGTGRATDQAGSAPVNQRIQGADELPPPPLTPLAVEHSTTATASGPRSSATHRSETAGAAREVPSTATHTSTSAVAPSGADAAGEQLAAEDGSSNPYTTFQQLEYLPTISPSVLASSHIIPPTYESVLSASPSPMPSQGMFPPRHGLSPNPQSRASSPAMATTLSSETFLQAHHHPRQQSQLHADPFLLSPVSLLANPSAKIVGPPGLFFVSKGRSTSNIVDGDGRSIMKKPLNWLDGDVNAQTSSAESAQGLDIFTRLEVLQTYSKTRLSLLAFGPTSLRAIELGGPFSNSIEVIPADAYRRRLKSLQASSNSLNNAANNGQSAEEQFLRDVTYLAKVGEATFFSERVGNSIVLHALRAMGTVGHTGVVIA